MKSLPSQTVKQPSNNHHKKNIPIKPLLFLVFLAMVIFSVRYFHLEAFLEKERLRQWIAGYGYWGPVVYLLVLLTVPPLFLPGLPITLAGGILFGALWGSIYIAFGATGGAVLAFLVARYLARDWVAGKLAGSRLASLDDRVAQQGWKIVALTRLIPVFPFFILNYAFGLTKISLAAYTLATFFGMIPMTIAYAYFAANILDILQGKLSWQVLLGILLVVGASLIPVVYKKMKAQRGETEL